MSAFDPGVRVARPFGAPSRFRDRAHAVPTRAQAGAVSRDRLVVGLMTLDLVIMVLTQKFAVPLGGDAQVPLLLLTHYAIMAVLVLARRTVIDPTRLALYAAFMLLAIGSQLVPDRAFSLPSLALAIVVYAPLALVLPIERAAYHRILRNFQYVVAAICLLVFIQHAFQLTGHDMPTLENIQPEATVYHEYVYIQPLYWRAAFMKPNAIFLLEASHTSQMIAMGLIIELSLFHRLRYLTLFGCGLIATFAGTGLLMLALTSPFLLWRLRPALVVVMLLALPVIAAVAFASGWFDVIGKRTDEYEKQGSSAYGRFVAPVEILGDTLAQHDPATILFGIGAGNMEKRTGVLWLAFSKVFVEYGFIVFIAWLAFTSRVLFRTPGLWAAAWMVAIQYHLLNGAFLVPLHVYLCLVLTAGYRLPRAPAARPVTIDGPRRAPAKSACKAPGLVFN